MISDFDTIPLLMTIDILTTFPQMFTSPFAESIVHRAQEKSRVQLNIHNLRQWTGDKHHSTDNPPYGGGPGMILMVEPIDKALAALHAKKGTLHQQILLTSAKGVLYTQQTAQTLSTLERLVLICGHYEGVDERVAQHLVDDEVRIGNYILTGGELASMVIVDSVVRLLPGVLGDQESTKEESHSVQGYLEYPQYTRPETYKGWKVPSTLLSGNHQTIKTWRKDQASSLLNTR